MNAQTEMRELTADELNIVSGGSLLDDLGQMMAAMVEASGRQQAAILTSLYGAGRRG